MTTTPQIERVAFGTIAAIEAEYSLIDMGQDWLARNGFTHVVKIIGDAEWDVEFATSETEARAMAKDISRELNVPFTHI